MRRPTPTPKESQTASPSKPSGGSSNSDQKKSTSSSPNRLSDRSRAVLVAFKAVFLLFALSVSNSSSRERVRIRNGSQTNRLRLSVEEEKSQCTLWLAASSLKGNPGMGVFTTRHIPKGDKVIPVNDGLTIPLYNFYNHEGPNEQQHRAFYDLWSGYVWSRNKPDHISYEENNDDMSSFAPCFSSLTNHHCTLKSLHKQYPAPFYDDTLANRFQDPGAGAFTYDVGRENIVERDVDPGEELFLNYGYCEHGKHKADWAENNYMPADFKKAKEITIDLMWKSLRVKNGGGMALDASNTLPIPKHVGKLVSELLPKTGSELGEMLASVDSVTDLEDYIATHNGLNHYGDPDWVRANGMCLENFLPGKSTTIPQAGRGAIAQFSIQKGETVAPAPLLQIMDKEALTMYKNTGEQWEEKGKQLLLNYCFGHPQSSLLLCPQTNIVLINHCSERTKECGLNGPNAEIRWAGDWHGSTKTWLQMSLDDMSKETVGGLAFDVVALRDIKPGEEVFIDYGREWEEAWKRHVASWKPANASGKAPWITAKEANDHDGGILDEFVTGDLRQTIDHPYLFTGCQYWPSKQDNNEVYQKDALWRKLSDKKILKRYADNGQSDGYREYARHYDHMYWPCSILKRSGNDTYTVRILQSPFEDVQPWWKHNVPRLLKNYPRKAIRYFVKPNMSDHHLDGIFRHPIGIPDSMFPKEWKNLKNVS